MKCSRSYSRIYAFLFLIAFLVSCDQPDKALESNESAGAGDKRIDWGSEISNEKTVSDIFVPISEFVRRIFQDSSGNLWFGTNGDGFARYDGDTLEFFVIHDGFGGSSVRGIVEDSEGNIWFGTSGGLTRYDANSFTNFTHHDGLVHPDIWTLMIDSKE